VKFLNTDYLPMNMTRRKKIKMTSMVAGFLNTFYKL
jgi:hypothetical protein